MRTSSGVLGPAQFQSIMAQLPHDGKQSEYADARYVNGGHVVDASEISKAAQNPEHPAHPQHPQVGPVSAIKADVLKTVCGPGLTCLQHGQWAKKLGGRLGNAAVFGAGASMGADLVHGIGL